MLLSLSTWPEVEDYLKTSKGIIVPVGSTEQHGPMGFIGTDAICPEKIAHDFARQSGVLVAPTLPLGMSQHHLGFSGSITLRPSTFMAVVKDVIQSLAVHGFTHFLFFNGHGGNVGPLNAAFSEIYADYSLRGKSCPLHCKVMNWYEGDRVKAIIDRNFGENEGSHATPGELSLSFHAHARVASTAPLDLEIPPNGDFRDAADFRKNYPDGRMGSNSAMADPAMGQALCRAGVEDIEECFRAFTPATG